MDFQLPERFNWSTIKLVGVSPKHYVAALQQPREDTDALQTGRAIHTAIYEPEEFEKRYLVSPRFNRAMKDETALSKGYDGGREAYAAFMALAVKEEAEIIPAETRRIAIAVRDSLHADPVTGPMIRGGYSEQSLEWTDEETGMPCRGRVDHVNGRLSDLKTTTHDGLLRFPREIAKYSYHGQIAFYSDGLAACGIEVEHPPAIIAVEKAAPYDAVVYELGARELDAGRRMYREYLRTIQRCAENGDWPGISGGKVVPLELPEWAMPKVELTMGGVALGSALELEA